MSSKWRAAHASACSRFGWPVRTPTPGSLVVENCDVIGQMLRRAGLETSGNVGELIPKLAGHEFGARLAIYPDSRTGRTFNSIAAIIPEDAP